MKFYGVMIGTEDPKKLGEFYTKVLGKPDMSEGGWYGWGKEGGIVIGEHSEVKGKNDTPGRIMTNWVVDDVKQEFERIADLGAEVVAEPYTPEGMKDMWLATFADPDGNYFQLSSPWQE